MDTLTVTKKVSQRKSSIRRKEKRRQRMLKFQRRLLDVRGLPPSSLMQTPDLSSDLGKVRRRNLVTDFAQEDGEDVALATWADAGRVFHISARNSITI